MEKMHMSFYETRIKANFEKGKNFRNELSFTSFKRKVISSQKKV